MKTSVTFLILLFLCSQHLFSQQDVFKVGLLGGANIAQIGTAEGSFYTGAERDFFQKTHHGLNLGLLATMQVSEYSQLGMEFLFSQNGKYLKTDPILEKENVDIWINYLEVPVHYNWQSNISRKKDFNNFHFQAGVAYARLLKGASLFVKNKIDKDPDFFNGDRALLLQSGMTFLITEKFGLNLRISVPAGTSWTGMTFAGRWVVMLK